MIVSSPESDNDAESGGDGGVVVGGSSDVVGGVVVGGSSGGVGVVFGGGVTVTFGGSVGGGVGVSSSPSGPPPAASRYVAPKARMKMIPAMVSSRRRDVNAH